MGYWARLLPLVRDLTAVEVEDLRFWLRRRADLAAFMLVCHGLPTVEIYKTDRRPRLARDLRRVRHFYLRASDVVGELAALDTSSRRVVARRLYRIFRKIATAETGIEAELGVSVVNCGAVLATGGRA